jgi:peptidoglycan/xylan/chitin deacetylase (PgdA/CDA1 family)
MKSVAPRLSLFRFPYGACNARALQEVHDHGLRAIQWDLSTGDSESTRSPKAIARALVANARPGSIILAHANGRGWHTATALPLAVPKLRAMGFEFVTVSELLDAGTPVVSQTCFDSRPGDTDRYDHPPRRRPPAPPSTSFWFW